MLQVSNMSLQTVYYVYIIAFGLMLFSVSCVETSVTMYFKSNLLVPFIVLGVFCYDECLVLTYHLSFFVTLPE